MDHYIIVGPFDNLDALIAWFEAWISNQTAKSK